MKKTEHCHSLSKCKLIGRGGFGRVFLCRSNNNEMVAVKRIIVSEEYKSHEFDILQTLSHPNCIKVIERYTTKTKNKEIEHIIMEFMDYNLYSVINKYKMMSQRIPFIYIKLFSFQLFSGLAYIHSKNIIHRDIKPDNILVNIADGSLKICDFGSAKVCTDKTKLETYAVTRYYRAPELFINCREYDGSIDVWAAGCVIYEMIAGNILFKGNSASEMLDLITNILGNPTTFDLHSIPHDIAFPFSCNRPLTLEGVLPQNIPSTLVDLLKRIFVYNPKKRITAKECLKHKFFDELFVKGVTLPNEHPLPVLIR